MASASQETAFQPSIIQHASISVARSDSALNTSSPQYQSRVLRHGLPSDSRTTNLFRTSLTSEEAVSKIASFRALSQVHAHLHPDSVLTASIGGSNAYSGSSGAPPPDIGGVQFSSTGGREGGLLMHYLHRVERGLSGEDMGGQAPNLSDYENSAVGLITAIGLNAHQLGAGGDEMDVEDHNGGEEKNLNWVEPSDFAQEEEKEGQASR